MKRKNQFKKITIIFSLALLIFIIGLTTGGRERVTKFENLVGNSLIPIQKSFNIVADFTESIIGPIIKIWDNQNYIEQLELENEELREHLIVATLDANEYCELMSLRDVFNFIDDYYVRRLISARVVSKDPGNLYNMFVINKGLKDNITKNSVVINGYGLVGLAYETSDNWSKVISIIDNKSSIGFKILDPIRNFEGIINGGIDGKLKGMLFDPKAKVIEGDLIITSGKGLYPEGIVIGRVKEIKIDKDIFLINIVVEPLVNFAKLDRVLIVPTNFYNEVGN